MSKHLYFGVTQRKSRTSKLKLTYYEGRPYYSTLTHRYYADYDEAFRDSRREGGGAEIDFNLFHIHPTGKVEIVF